MFNAKTNQSTQNTHRARQRNKYMPERVTDRDASTHIAKMSNTGYPTNCIDTTVATQTISGTDGCKTKPINAHSPFRGHVNKLRRFLFAYSSKNITGLRNQINRPLSHNLLQQLTSALEVTHLFVRLGKIKFRINLFPMRLIARTRLNSGR